MSDDNFIFESFIDFMKFMKLSKGTFESFTEILNWNYLSKIKTGKLTEIHEIIYNTFLLIKLVYWFKSVHAVQSFDLTGHMRLILKPRAQWRKSWGDREGLSPPKF